MQSKELTNEMIKNELIQEALRIFSFELKEFKAEYFFDYINFDSEPIQVKIISKITFKNNQTIVVRITRENHIAFDHIQKESFLSETFRKHGINTPKRYSVNSQFAQQINYNKHIMYVTIEDYVGPHIEKLNRKLLFELGSILSKMHKVAEVNNLSINSNGYVYNVIGTNEVINIGKLIKLSESYGFEQERINKINHMYFLIQKEITKQLSSLNKYAVHGDLNTTNISLYNNELCIYDYNIACDEYFVVMLAIDSLMMIYEEQYEEILSKEDKFQSFIDGYNSNRTLNVVEKHLLPIIINFADALWFSKIHLRDNSLEYFLKNNDQINATKIIDNMFYEISSVLNMI